MNYPDVQQLQRLLSQDSIRSWEMWHRIQQSLDTCKSKEMRQWTSQHAVIEITSLSLSQMVVSFPSDTERCLQLTREGVVIGDHAGFDSSCLFDILLQFMLQHQMLKQLAGTINTINWRREACDTV